MEFYRMNEKRLFETFYDLLKINSPSYDEGGVARYIAARFKKKKIQVFRDQSFKKFGGKCGNVLARIEGKKSATPIVFSVHMDTVVATKKIKIVEDGDIIRSDGKSILGADNKAGVACVLELMETIASKKRNIGTVEFLFSAAEEVGLEGIKHFDFDKLKAQAAFVVDSGHPVGTVVTRSPYAAKVEAVITGKTAHAGVAPEEGISAIQVAAKAINRMRLGRINEDTTANLGKISGGTATNIIPGKTTLKGEARSFSDMKLQRQLKHMHDCFVHSTELLGGSVKFKTEPSFIGFDIDKSEAVVKMVMRAARSLRMKPQIRSTGGGSDANVFNERGIRAIVLGQGYSGAHSEEEHISKTSMIKMVEFLENLVTQAIGKR
jgi:tripeptide aminopeptidase